MATQESFIEYVVGQLENAGEISYKKMFGEYALYCDEKVVALVCDNQVFVKPTDAGKSVIGKVVEAPPYPGAKNYYLVDAVMDDKKLFCKVIRSTADALPLPKPKKPKTKKQASSRKKK